MAILDVIAKAFGGSLLGGVKDLIGQFHLSPEKKAELQSIVDQNEFVLKQKQMELEEKVQDSISREIDAASSNIRAEAQTGDKYTSRARPTFLYLMYVILGWNYIALPLIQYWGGKPPQPIQFPDALMWLFGSGYLGYCGARSWDKYFPKAGQ